jgi:hypothetical protein
MKIINMRTTVLVISMLVLCSLLLGTVGAVLAPR